MSEELPEARRDLVIEIVARAICETMLVPGFEGDPLARTLEVNRATGWSFDVHWPGEAAPSRVEGLRLSQRDLAWAFLRAGEFLAESRPRP